MAGLMAWRRLDRIKRLKGALDMNDSHKVAGTAISHLPAALPPPAAGDIVVAPPPPQPPAAVEEWPLEKLSRFAQICAASSLVPTAYRGHPEDCVIAMMHGLEVGLKPLQALASICVINGTPSLFGDALLGIVRNSNLCEYVNETKEFDETGRVVAAVCEAKRRGEPHVCEHRFSLTDAERAGLLKRPGPWQQYPARMLQMRARSWTLRDAFPDLLMGMIATEEVQDYPPAEPPPKRKAAKPPAAATSPPPAATAAATSPPPGLPGQTFLPDVAPGADADLPHGLFGEGQEIALQWRTDIMLAKTRNVVEGIAKAIKHLPDLDEAHRQALLTQAREKWKWLDNCERGTEPAFPCPIDETADPKKPR